jgi:hypothetical protein
MAMILPGSLVACTILFGVHCSAVIAVLPAVFGDSEPLRGNLVVDGSEEALRFGRGLRACSRA